MKHYFVLSIVITALFFTTMTAFGQGQLIFVETSQNSYEQGETIVVSGNVTSIITDTPVILQIIHEGNYVQIAQIDVAQDGKYAHTIIADGDRWDKDGTYTVKVSYAKTSMEISFQFFSKQASIETTHTFDVDAGSYGTFDVDYTIRGATVEDMRVDPVALALLVILETDEDGVITLKLPRESIDAKIMNGQDDNFIIFIDGAEVPYTAVSTNSESRTISIEFEEGESDIEIIGTFVVPEFGNIVMIILFIGIFSTILLSTRYRIPIKI